MSEQLPPLLSDLVSGRDVPSDRRTFLTRAGLLSLAIPGVGAALTACSPSGAPSDTSHARAGAAPDTGTEHPRIHNSDSRLDSALLKKEHRAPSSATGTATQGAASTTYQRYAPELPPLPAGGTQSIHWHAREVPIRISDDTVLAAWTFEGQFPGPIIHTRVGDTVEFTLTNDAFIPHSMDFHAAQIDPKANFKSVAKGQSLTFTFKPKWAGAFMYHCGTAPVLMHIGAGMHGAIIVSPRDPLPPAKEFVLVHSELYLDEVKEGMQASSFQKMLNTTPDLVVFNGRPNQYIKDPIRVKVGDRVRFWVVSAGPQYQCSFHVVGEQFDTVYLGAPPNSAIRGVQTFAVPPGGGMCFELMCDIAGEFPFVNHSFGHGQKGAIGILKVE
ncbi:MAG TPA: multicopper oxidase domain-containing protein [Gemmatimonadaceae bacterium]|nr:multicopper oxidase domain-containing protein [Gemmatimonadaceae bacterium]